MNKYEELFSNNNLIPLETVKNTKQKVKVKTLDGYFFNVTVSDLKSKGFLGNKIVNHLNPYSIHNIHQFLKNKNSNIILLSSIYVDNKKELDWKCLNCGRSFKLSWQNFLHSPRKNCSVCNRNREKALFYAMEYVKSECEKHGLKKMDDEYVDARTPFLVENKDGFRDMKCLTSISCGKTQIRFMIRNPYLFYNMRLWFKLNNYNCDIVEKKYKKMSEKMTFKCACGREYECLPCSIFYSPIPSVRCPRCAGTISSYELKIINFLKKKKIKYIQQYRFEDCKLFKPLPFDFYLPEYNVCIEVDGEQHFARKMQTEKEFEDTKKRDKIKDEYCKDNGIKLIRIPYWEMNNKKYKNKLNKILIYD